MYPILFESTEKDFTTNGLGRLKDAISCSVTEERNGTYELSMVYPISGIHYDLLENDRIIYAMPADGKNSQPFRIYKISRPLSGKVTVSAEHISYLLASAVVMPFTASSCADAISKLNSSVIGASGFSFWTDKAVTGTYTLDKPTEVRTVLGGSSGSLLDTYGKGEYEFDGFNVKLYLNRGVDNGVTIRYGKNLTDITADTDMTNVYTGIVPYATTQDSDGNEITVTLSEKVVKSSHTGDFAYPLYKVVDFSQNSNSEETMTEDELRTLATDYVNNNNGWEVNNNLTVSFVALWQTDEYKNVAALERVNLCDTVHVVYTDLGVNTTAKVVKTDFDVLNERYNSIELGENTSNLSKTLNDAINSSTEAIADEVSGLPAAITKATKKLAGGLGGYVVLSQNANGEPEEILIMDTNDKNTAQNVIRMNKNGIGFSTTGYQGPFANAWTIDGKLVADYITTGTLSTVLIKSLTENDVPNYWNLSDGTYYLGDAGAHISHDGSNAQIVLTNGTVSASTITTGTMSADRVRSGVLQSTNGKLVFDLDNGLINVGDGGYLTLRGILNIYWQSNLIGCLQSYGVSSGGKTTYELITGLYKDHTRGYGIAQLYDDGTFHRYSMLYEMDDNAWFFYNNAHVSATGSGGYFKATYLYGTLSSGSDSRLKSDIKGLDTDKAVGFIMALKPSEYRYNANPNEVRHGFIAQDVQTAEYDDWHPVSDIPKDEDGNVYLGLNYIDLIADMVATIQSQHKRITALEERLAKIEEMFNADN